MGGCTVIHREKLEQSAKEVNTHLLRLEQACVWLRDKYGFPIDGNKFSSIFSGGEDLAYADQIVYRFSKTQDAIGAKLLKAFMLYQGEDTDKPFLDILNSLEKAKILLVDEWMVLRDLHNDISHNYDNNPQQAVTILNDIYKHKDELKNILYSVVKVAGIKL